MGFDGGDGGDGGVVADAPGNPKGDADPAAPDGAPGFDAQIGTGSYTVIESTAPYDSPASAQPIPGFAVGSDDQGFVLALPFTFVFYGIPYTSVIASVNGFLTFGAAPSQVESYRNDCPFDATAPDAVIAVFWDDLVSPSSLPNGAMSFASEGSPPDRFTIEWRDLDAFYQAGNGNNAFSQGMRTTHEVVLHADGSIDLHYGPRTPPTQDKDCGLTRHQGCSATVGLEAPGGMSSVPIQCGTSAGWLTSFAPVVDGRLITFVPN